MAEAKAMRLSKVAKELNIGIDRIGEFLASKGVDIVARPTTKIDGEVYELLLDEFQADQRVKSKSEEVAAAKQAEKEALKAEQEKKEEEKVIKAKADVAGPKAVGKIDLDPPKKEEPKKEEPKKEEAKAETKETPKAEEAPKKEEAKAEPKAEEKAEPKAEEKTAKKEEPKQEEAPAAEAKDSVISGKKELQGLKEVGKIDLDSLKKPKKKPAAKAEDKPAEKAEPKKEAPKKEEAKAEKPAEAEAPAEEPKAAEEKGSDVIKAKKIELKGITNTGKTIDLSQFEKKKKKKVASSADNKGGDKSKRQRKRISTGGNDPKKGPARGKKGAKPNPRAPKVELTDEQIQKQVRETLEKLTGGSKKSKSAKFRRAKRDERKEQAELEQMRQEEENKTIKVTEFVTVSELATMMNVSTTEVISSCMTLGIMVTMNQRLDAETLSIVAEEFGYEVEFISADVSDAIQEEPEDDQDAKPRAPIVTVMGHVDHGKTSLLDHIRKANVIAGEAGGITQHIGAYSVELSNKKRIAFIDTPGHEAFTAMRARGAQVTDIAIIVIAADDDVMPQTKEAISHAQAAGVPMVFAINKIDKPGANPEKVKESLSQMNLLVEDWGGKYQSQEVSAKKGQGVDELLEKVLLEAELLELKANADRQATGTVIEASLDKGRGYVSTLLVQNGTLKVGDYVLAGQYSGKVKALQDERGNRVEEVGPATPVIMLGLDGAPTAGDKFNVMEDEKEAKAIATRRNQLQREQSVRTQKHITLDEIGRRLAIGDFQELNIVLKGDVDGSIEALADSLQKLSTEEIQVNIIHKAVGQVTESDILLASASDAIVIGFQVRPSAGARKLAEKEEVDIRLYSIIYDAIDEVKSAMEGMLSPDVKEEIVANVEVRETFKISKVGTIAGCMVTEGKINRNHKIRVIRDGIVVYTGELGSLKRFKDDVKEVAKGYECGLNVANFNDIKVGDIIEAYEEVEVKKLLS